MKSGVIQRLYSVLSWHIRDNGVGFDMEAIHEGFGLGNIKHRAAQIGATLYFNRGISQGSSLEVIIERLENANKSIDT